MEKTEILMKLISLANNNPNEHEANAAARRVCKMLAEMKINFISKKAPTQQQQTRPRPSNPFDFDMPDIYEILKNMHREQSQYERERARYNPWGNPFYTEPPRQRQEEPKPPKKEKVTRECADCGKKHMTRCEGVFYCNTCQWRRYQENKQKQSHA